jgi:opacity protein-like surface antigen
MLGHQNANYSENAHMATGITIMEKVALCVFFLLTPLVAQDRYVTDRPTPAVSSPVVEASVGYTYLGLDTPSQKRIGLRGVDANAFVDFNPRWGIMLDSSYARAGNVLGTGHGGNVLSVLCGPVFYPLDLGKTRIFVHTMAGVSLVNSAVPVQGTYYLGGTLTRFSYAVGGGVERTVTGPLAIRIGAVYLRTTFANSTAALHFQNNIRITTGIVYRFGTR